MKNLLVWDVDGTLVRTRGLGKKAMDMAFCELYGIKDAFRTIDMAGMLDAVILRKVYELHNMDKRDSGRFFARYAQILEEEFAKANRPIACPGVPELLQALEHAGSFLNVLGTGNIEKGARIKLSVDGLNRFFPTGGFGDLEMERWELVAAAVSNAAKYFNLEFDKRNIYIIGDTPRDVECGKKLGLMTIAVATGPYSRAQLKDCGADHVFDNLMDTAAFMKIFRLT